jgi:PPOX class probable F420-dependent enzyme
MGGRIPESLLDLFQKRALGHLVTLFPDGRPQVTPVWVDYDGTYIIVNTIEQRQKAKNMCERPQVALDIVDPDDDYRWLSIRGHVVEITTSNAEEHLSQLSARYLGTPHFLYRVPAEVRVIFKISTDSVVAWYEQRQGGKKT